MSNFLYFPLTEAHLASGVTVVVDVLRAFTTAAYALAAGASEIYPVGTVAEALELKNELPNALTMGEVDALKPEEFDFGNSPAVISKQKLQGKILIQRTSAGTQGIVKAVNADYLLAASFVVACATAAHLQNLAPSSISFIITGQSLGRDGDEDRACAEYIAALVSGRRPDPDAFIDRVKTSTVGQLFLDSRNPHLSKVDFEMSIRVDQFNFPLLINCAKQRLVMKTNLTAFHSKKTLKIE
jgi:2-phosphosulfolactate phosphatase